MRSGETQPDNKEMVTRETAARWAFDVSKGVAKPIRCGGCVPNTNPHKAKKSANNFVRALHFSFYQARAL